MGLLSQFFKSDTKLTRPEFERASDLVFTFSDTKVKIRDPAQTATIPYVDAKTVLDLFSTNFLEPQKIGNESLLVYKRGWNFWGKGSIAKGGVVSTMVVHHFPEKNFPGLNIFDVNGEKSCLLLHWHALFGETNEAKGVGDIGTGDYKYPVSGKEVEIVKNSTGLGFLKTQGVFTLKLPNEKNAPLIKYSIPLTSRHLLVFSFEMHAFRSVDFYSPETNLKESAYAVVEDFMNSVSVSYSHAAQKERQNILMLQGNA